MQKYSHLKNISLVGVWLLFCSDSCSLSKMLLPSVWGCCFVNDNSLTYAARQLMLTANHTSGVWWRGWIDVSCWRNLTPSTPLSFTLEATSSLKNVKKVRYYCKKMSFERSTHPCESNIYAWPPVLTLRICCFMLANGTPQEVVHLPKHVQLPMQWLVKITDPGVEGGGGSGEPMSPPPRLLQNRLELVWKSRLGDLKRFHIKDIENHIFSKAKVTSNKTEHKKDVIFWLSF